jgi:hypothetical protein
VIETVQLCRYPFMKIIQKRGVFLFQSPVEPFIHFTAAVCELFLFYYYFSRKRAGKKQP